MKAINKIIALGIVAATATSCSLDLAPVDFHGSQSYWKNENSVIGYVDGLMKNMRDFSDNHVIVMGEQRSGIYVDNVGYEGMTQGNGVILHHTYDETTPAYSNFANIYGYITNCNLLIARAEAMDNINQKTKEYCLGVAYGLRAFYYFELYRNWGGVPIRTGVEVIDGELNPTKLTVPRALPSEVMTQIKADIEKSISLFGDQTGFNVLGHGYKAYWNKAASLCLAADIYMWNAKVALGDQQAVPADMDKAIGYLQQVETGFGLALKPNFADVFNAQTAAKNSNEEVIYAVRFLEGEATNNNLSYTYNMDTGNSKASGYLEDGTPWAVDILKLQGIGGTNQSRGYLLGLWENMDDQDTRKRATFLAQYRYTQEEEGVTPEFYLHGLHVQKNIGYINAQGVRVSCGDHIYYRLPWVYLALAEAYNFKGEYQKCADYINKVRERAYGANWGDEFKYVPGDFKQNEYAVLWEKDKEFVQEGQRWWDIRRMTEVKGGSYKDHFVFKADASYRTNPTRDKNGHISNPGEKYPTLTDAEKHKVLFPLDVNMMNNDPSLLQQKEYESTKGKVEWTANGN